MKLVAIETNNLECKVLLDALLRYYDILTRVPLGSRTTKTNFEIATCINLIPLLEKLSIAP